MGKLGPSCAGTALVVEHAGRQQIIMNGQKFARSYDLETGEELWRCPGQTVRPIGSPPLASRSVAGTTFLGCAPMPI